MKQLKLAGDLFPAAVSGMKQITIRKGIRDFEAGETVEIVNVDNPEQIIERTLTEVTTYQVVWQIPLEKITADGFDGHTHMVESMKRFYPDFDVRTPVTILQWEQ
jgi:hypothetical protein